MNDLIENVIAIACGVVVASYAGRALNSYHAGVATWCLIWLTFRAIAQAGTKK